MTIVVRVSCRILSWGGGGGRRKQDGSRMIVRSCTRKHAWVCGHAPKKNLEFRSSQIASDTILDKILKFQDFLGKGGYSSPLPTLYETLVVVKDWEQGNGRLWEVGLSALRVGWILLNGFKYLLYAFSSYSVLGFL